MAEKPLKLQCPVCQKRLKVAPKSLGKQIVCPKCNGRFRISGSKRATRDQNHDLFGPPVKDDYQKFDESSEDAFGDIDQLIRDNAEASGPPNRQPNSQQNSAGAAEKPKMAAPDNGMDAESSAVHEQWQQTKKITTDFDDSLNRNGIGLTILSIGLALMPMLAGGVESLEPYLFYLPIAAISISFVAAFMVCYSLRRGSSGALVLSCMPFLVICFLSFVSYLFFIDVSGPSSDPQQALADGPIDPADDSPLLDKSAVEDNVIDSFAPPKKSKETEWAPVPEIKNEPNDQPAENKPLPTTNSGLRPSELLNQPTQIVEPDPTLRAAFDLEKKASQAGEKKKVLRQRVQRKLGKSLVSKNHRSRKFDQAGLTLSTLVGTETVYGSAVFADRPIRGFDTSFGQRAPYRWIHSLVPILDEAEFFDSIVAPKEKRLLGVRLKLDDRGAIGVQAIFGDGFSEPEFGEWIGEAGEAGSARVESIQTDSTIHGFLIYRNQFNVVGLRLIISDRQ